MIELAKLGPLGVGVALAILTYGLLRGEQALPTQRKSLIRLYWGFMAFSLVLALSGFVFDKLSGSIRLVTDGERNRVGDQGEPNLRAPQFECLRKWMLDELLAARSPRHVPGECVAAR